MAMDEEFELVVSPLCQVIERDGVKVRVHISLEQHTRTSGS